MFLNSSMTKNFPCLFLATPSEINKMPWATKAGLIKVPHNIITQWKGARPTTRREYREQKQQKGKESFRTTCFSVCSICVSQHPEWIQNQAIHRRKLLPTYYWITNRRAKRAIFKNVFPVRWHWFRFTEKQCRKSFEFSRQKSAYFRWWSCLTMFLNYTVTKKLLLILLQLESSKGRKTIKGLRCTEGSTSLLFLPTLYLCMYRCLRLRRK